MLPARGALALLILVLGAARLHANQADDIIFDLNDEELMEASLPETDVHKDNGIMGRLRRIRSGFFDFFDINPSNSSTETTTPAAIESDAELESYRRDSEEDTGIDDLREDIYTTESIDLEDPYTEREDEENGNVFGSGDTNYNTIQHRPAKEVTMRVSFILGEPYQQESNQKDSNLFQQLSLSLADAVNALYDHYPGEQRATLVRIQSRPADELTCKVTLDLTTVEFYNYKSIESTLRDHIRSRRRLANYTVSDDEFSFELFDACVEDDLVCDVTRCVPKTKKCDGIPDCNDGTDEKDCPGRCQPDEFRCNNGDCIDGNKKCDKVMDCKDFTDEAGCPCGRDDFTCLNGKCIEHRKVCDGRDNCDDGSDESNCAGPAVNCAPHSFRCYSDKCIDIVAKCNGISDCPDNEDEMNCPTGDCYGFLCRDGTCLADAEKQCNSVPDCPDGSDEDKCYDCEFYEFRCDNGECINSRDQCDGKNDCTDWSDERGCTNNTHSPCEMYCEGNCIYPDQVCDGTKDCSDGDDEKDCDYHNCKNKYECNDGTCIRLELVCDGKSDCFNGEDESECSNAEGCDRDKWQCRSGECIFHNERCDGIAHCRDQSDEDSPPCQPATRPPVVVQTPGTYPPYPITTAAPFPTPPTRSPFNIYPPSGAGKLELRTYPNDQIIRQKSYGLGGDVVFLCRDEGAIRASVRWVRANGLPLPQNSTDVDGRLEMPNIQISHSGVYICRADGYSRGSPGSELSVMLTVEPFEHTSSQIGFPRCELHEATCSNGDCIPKSSVCDGNYDCSDGSDEDECQSHGCEPNEFLCSNRRCILKTWLCDSDDDCRDGSDEAHCSPQSSGNACRSNEFQCESSQCVPRGFHCDGERDCVDGSDEVGCSPVYISQPPKPMLLLSKHETMVITCKAIGVPTPEVVWRRNWDHIPGHCSYTSVDGLGTLTCPDIQPEDQGAYSCEALNNKGSVFAVPDTMLLVNGSKIDKVCPDGYFNSEARSAQECISCFCFGATTKCKSADLFTYQLPTPLGQGGTRLVGVVQPPGEPLQVTDEPISDSFTFSPTYNGVTITRVGPRTQRNIHPYISLPENYQGSQLTSYGGFIRYSIESHGDTSGFQPPLPVIIVKGGGNTLIHFSRSRNNDENNISVQLFPEYWQKVTPYGQQPASREDIMMTLANVEVILLLGEVGGDGVVITNFKMDSAQSVNTGQGSAAFVEECECPQAYRGLSCHNCNQGYTRVASGSWLGQCVREQQKCQPGYYGDPSNGISCQKCPCPLSNPKNQFASTCHLDRTGQVTCDCISGYEGRRCEMCAPGYVGNPTIPGDYCRPGPPPSSCDPRGTELEEDGYCKCKLYTEGEKCDRCRDDAFHLSADNENGCSNCFCMGVTTSCGISSLRRRTYTLQFVSSITSPNVEIMELPAGSQTKHLTPVQVNLETDVKNRELLLRSFQSSNPGTYYWSLPNSFTGDKVTAYGGMLTYSLRHIPAPGGQSSRNNAPDVQLHSVDNEILLYHYSGATPNYNGFLNGSVQLTERYWQRVDGNPATREYMLQALADLSSLLIKATYTTKTYEAALVSVSLETADETGNGPRALHVEQCKCPPGYLGTSCEDCAPGYTRSEDGIYLGFCEQCNCNGHSDQCHPETGECYNCLHNTNGDSCEECSSGYQLDENRVCSQPGSNTSDCRCDPRGTLGSCRFGVCQCKSNVEGDRCQQCRSGTFYLQEENPRGCKDCYCSGVSNRCHEAIYWYRQQIPIAIIDDNHDFTLTTLNKDRVISSDFKLNLQFNQIGYLFGPYLTTERYFWTLPTFNGNKVLSYGGYISITQKYETNGYERESTDDIDVVLIGKTSTIYWINPRKLQPSVPLSYIVPLKESEWKVLGESPSLSVTRAQFMSVLADLESVLVRATLSQHITETYIADLSMDTALEENTGQVAAHDIELCTCPEEYTGTSCERCATGYYKDRENRCVPCNCNGRAQSCSLGPNDNVICDCEPPYQGPDCSAVVGEDSHEGGGDPPPLRPSIRVTVSAPTIQIKAVGSTVRFKCDAHSKFNPSIPLNVTWSREGGSLPRGRSMADARGELVIRNVKESDSGTYICRATDGIQSGEDRATLTVPGNEATAPQVVLRPPYVDVYEGDPIELQCLAQGNPLPTLTWVRVRAPAAVSRDSQFSNGIFRIESATLSDQGDYKCIASNSAGSVDMTAVIYVRPREVIEPVPNQFIIQPSSPILVEGDSTRIVCSATNVPSSNIVWTRVNGYLPNNFASNNGLLLITSANQENSGVYECSAPNAGISIHPSTVVITVHPNYPTIVDEDEEAPSVTIDNTNLTIPEGETRTINCQPQGNPLPIIKWNKVGSEFGPGVSQRGNSLIISRAQQSDRGRYVCKALSHKKETVAQASTAVEIERREVPEVEIWPEGVQAMTLGGNAQLMCRIVAGIPEPAVTWSRPNGRQLSANTHLLTGGVLSFNDVSVNEEGEYICTASNIAGQGSATASLSVQSPPSIVIMPDEYITVNEGAPINIECRISGHPEPQAHWSKLHPYNRVLGQDTSNVAHLNIKRAQPDDEGTYVCVARNSAGTTEVQIKIVVDADTDPPRGDIPSFENEDENNDVEYDQRPDSFIAVEGQPFPLSCRSQYGVETKWVRPDGRPLPYSSVESPNFLNITNVTHEDEGIYECRGKDINSGATVFIARTSLVVVIPPKISLRPKIQTVRPGDTAYLRCDVIGSKPMHIEWLPTKGGTIPFSDRVSIQGSILTFRAIEVEDAGQYVCRANNTAGEAEAFAEVIVNDNQRPIGGSITIDAPQQPVLAGDNIRIDCRANPPNINVSWRKVGFNQKINSRNYAGGSVLDLTNVQQSDEGVYRCEGTDDYDRQFADEFILYVQPAPQSPEPVQREEDVIQRAPLGSTIELPCSTNLNGPVRITWHREKGSLPSAIDPSNPNLRLTSITERDAGPYICKAWNGQTEIERRIILQVTNVIPQFSGDSYVALDTLKDAFLKFDIEISIKPMDYNGILLYNSLEYEPVEPDDMVSLTLVNGIPEFKFDFGAGPATVRGDTALELGKWHTIKIRRNEEKGFMYIDGNNKPFSGIAPGTRTGLDLKTPLYIGGVPDYNMLPPQFINRTGFIGCVSRLVLNKEEISIMRQAILKHNIEECDSCQPNPCHNGAVCQNALNEKGVTCICRPGFAGYDCSRIGDGCAPGLCGEGRCLDTENGFKCNCPLGYLGERCETQQKIEYPAFGGGAFMAYQPPKSANLKMYLKVKPASPVKDGIIMYWAESRHGYGGFTSLAVNRGYLEFRFDTGSGPEVLRSNEPLKANEWTEILISRMLDVIKLTVNQEKTLIGKIPDKGKTLKFVTSMYIGGYDEEVITLNNRTEVSGGFNGCIKDVKVFSKLLDIHSSIIHSANIHECGTNNDDKNRGDIPVEANTLADELTVCVQCENGGYCTDAIADSCTCPSGFSGRYCELSRDKACDSQPCYGGGTCRPTDDGLYKCDCPLGYGGYHCQRNIELRENIHFRGDGYVELPAQLLPHNRPTVPETIALAISTEQEDGVLFYQREKRAANFPEGNYILLQISRGLVELKWELGSGEGYVNSQVFVANGQRHSIIVKRTGSEADLIVDGYEQSSRAPGLTQTMNADSNLYIGGIPASLNTDEVSGFVGCIQQIELQESKAIDIGRTAIYAVNASPCANTQADFLNGGI